jgi:hypothetical protein
MSNAIVIIGFYILVRYFFIEMLVKDDPANWPCQ